MTGKKYQVFVSSTYRDLIEERSLVTHALLELDCIPSGMEMFPAGDDDQWDIIKRIIDSCDYCILIVAGRYGSEHSSGKSYTQMEYEYAVEKKIPVATFIRGKIKRLPAEYTEELPEKREKLNQFRVLVQKKICKFWDDTKELDGKVTRSIYQLIKSNPMPGWIRASQQETAGSYNETTVERIESILSVAIRFMNQIKPNVHFRCLVTLLQKNDYTRCTVCGVNIRTDPEHMNGVPADFGISGQAFVAGHLVADNLPEDHVSGYPVDVRNLVWKDLKSVIAVPLKKRGGQKIIGTLNFDSVEYLEDTIFDIKEFKDITIDIASLIEPYVSELYSRQ